MNIIEVKNLKKSYGKVEAVKDINFYVEEGSFFAFLGPNGAGKSTTIDILSTFLKHDSGEITVDGNVLGVDDDKIRNSIGIVFQEHLLDHYLTVEENLKIRGGFYGLNKKQLDETFSYLVEALDMKEFYHRRYEHLSGGQKRRADIGRALMNHPKILILDEPTTGLDPEARLGIWKILRKLQEEKNMTIFLTTHYMEEAGEADYIVVIDGGKIGAKGTPKDIRERYSSDYMILYTKYTEKISSWLMEKGYVYNVLSNGLRIELSSTKSSLPILNQWIEELDGYVVKMGTLDDAFINITRKDNSL